MMTNKVISDTQESNTYSRVALVSLWSAGVLIGGIALSMPPESGLGQYSAKYYSTTDNHSSYDSYTDLLKVSSLETFDGIIGAFYQKILTSQEQLEDEFREVYFKNAWNLYEE